MWLPLSKDCLSLTYVLAELLDPWRVQLVMLVFNLTLLLHACLLLLKDYDPTIFKAGIFSISKALKHYANISGFAHLIVSRLLNKAKHELIFIVVFRWGFSPSFPMCFSRMIIAFKKRGWRWRRRPPKMTLTTMTLSARRLRVTQCQSKVGLEYPNTFSVCVCVHSGEKRASIVKWCTRTAAPRASFSSKTSSPCFSPPP